METRKGGDKSVIACLKAFKMQQSACYYKDYEGVEEISRFKIKRKLSSFRYGNEYPKTYSPKTKLNPLSMPTFLSKSLSFTSLPINL